MPSSQRKSVSQLTSSANKDLGKHSVQYVSSLAYFSFAVLSLFLFIASFIMKWNTNEGCYLFRLKLKCDSINNGSSSMQPVGSYVYGKYSNKGSERDFSDLKTISLECHNTKNSAVS